MRAYAAFLVCGLCVALNKLAYLPRQTFSEAEPTEFTVTLPLLVIFLVSSVVAAILALKNRKNIALVVLLLATCVFVGWAHFGSGFQSQTGQVMQLAYPFSVFALAIPRMFQLRRFREQT
jgi:hypothetical protein